jgi:hypothetical protein
MPGRIALVDIAAFPFSTSHVEENATTTAVMASPKTYQFFNCRQNSSEKTLTVAAIFPAQSVPEE